MSTVTEGSGLRQYIDTDTKIIRKNDPVYTKPASKFGRAQFFAPYKQIGNLQIDTFWFNLMVLWIGILLFYLALYYNILKKLVGWIEKPGLRDSLKRGTHLSQSSTD